MVSSRTLGLNPWLTDQDVRPRLRHKGRVDGRDAGALFAEVRFDVREVHAFAAKLGQERGHPIGIRKPVFVVDR